MTSWRDLTFGQTVIATLGGIGVAALTTLHLVYGIRLRGETKKPKLIDPDVFDKNEHPLLCKSDGTITILSQNMWCVLLGGGSKRQKRLQLLIKHIDQDQPDIICLQEMQIFALGPILLCGDYMYIQQQLHQRGYIHHTEPTANMPFTGSSSGCVIFSKYPFISTDGALYKTSRIEQCKGWTYAHIAIPNMFNIKLFNTHLESKNQRKQMKQIMELHDVIEERSSSLGNMWKRPSVICVGDFNICSNQSYGSDMYERLKTGLAKVGLETDLYGDTKRTYSKVYPREGTKSLDHVFIDNFCQAKVQRTELKDYRDEKSGRIMSDHLGLLFSFKF